MTSEREIDALTRWIVEALGDETLLHFSALRPEFHMSGHPPTPPTTLTRARAQAKANGLRHVYAGEGAGEATFCAGCGAPLIARAGNRLVSYALDAEGACRDCGRMLAGHFARDARRLRRRARVGRHWGLYFIPARRKFPRTSSFETPACAKASKDDEIAFFWSVLRDARFAGSSGRGP